MTTGVGLSDFQVALAVGPHGQGLALAVLLDSPAWASRRTTSDRDALPTTVLERVMGWPGVARVWLPAWLEDPDAAVTDLVRAAHDAAARPRAVGERLATSTWSSGDAPQDEAPQDEALQDAAPRDAPQDAAPQDAAPQDVAPAQPPGIPELSAEEADPIGLGTASRSVQEFWVPSVTDVIARRSALDAAATGRGVDRIQDLMREIVGVEGPVSVGRLARLVAHAHGLARVLDERVMQLSRVVPPELRRDEEGFVWPDTRDPLRWNGFRRFVGPVKERSLDEVALREIGSAMVYITGNAMGIGVDELFKETYRVLGGNRVTPAVTDRLSSALALAARDTRLAVVGGVDILRS